jgi:hypothetical protein
MALLAFLQGFYSLSWMLGLTKDPFANPYPVTYLVPSVLMFGLGIAVFMRHLWGAFALVGMGILDTIVKWKIMSGGAAYSLIFPGMYVLGTWTLSASLHIAPQLRELRWRGIIGFTGLLFGGSFLWAFLLGFLGLRQQMETEFAYNIPPLIWALIIFSFLGKWGAPWRLESILASIGLTSLVNLSDTVVYLLRGYTLEASLLGWSNTIATYLALGLIGCGISLIQGLPALTPEDLSPRRLLLFSPEYQFADLMRDTRWLLIFVALVHFGGAYYLYTGNSVEGLLHEDWPDVVAMGVLFFSASLLHSFWFRFVGVAIWTGDLLYTDLFLETTPKSSIFITVGAFFLLLMWLKRAGRLVLPQSDPITPPSTELEQGK